jgi:hypothetical protein
MHAVEDEVSIGEYGSDRPFPDVIPRDRHQPLAHDRAVPLYSLASGFIREHPGFSSHRHAIPAAHNPDVHSLVLLGFPGKGASRYRVSLEVTRNCFAINARSVGSPRKSGQVLKTNAEFEAKIWQRLG